MARHNHCSVKQVLEQYSSAELSEQILFALIEPIPQPWLQTGLLCATVANGLAGSRSRQFDAEDFMPTYKGNNATQFENQLARAGITVINATAPK